MPSLEDKIISILGDLQEENNFRSLRLPNNLIDFSSNDYLGFAQRSIGEFFDLDPAIKSLDSGSGGSRLLTGNSKLHFELEHYLKGFFFSEAALLFNSGFEANAGLISTVAGRNDVVYYDSESHASIRDGVRLSTAKSASFKHNNPADIERLLKQQTSGHKFVVVESVYSMSGTIAPLKEIAEICRRYEANLIVDEAHAVGVLGPLGKGEVVEQKLQHDVFARVITFGKAIGSNGAAVLGSRALRDFLINRCRQFIYTTALPAWQATKILTTFKLIEANPDILDQLNEKIRRFRFNQSSKQKSASGPVAIQTILVPGNEAVKAASKLLQDQGFDVRPILSPTVPKGRECIRICLHIYNTNSEIDRLCNLITKEL